MNMASPNGKSGRSSRLAKAGLVMLVLCVMLLSACSATKKDETAYMHSRLLPPLKIPPGLEAPRVNDFMAILEVTAREDAPDDGRPIDAPPEILLEGER